MVRIIEENDITYIEVVKRGQTLREMYNDRQSVCDAACAVSNIVEKLL